MKGNLLRAEIVSNGWTQKDFANQMKKRGVTIGQSGLSMRLQGKREFKQSEIDCISHILKLSPNQIKNIFFSEIVA